MPTADEGTAFSIAVETSADALSHVVHITGEIDLSTAPALRSFLMDLGGEVAVDCADVEFIDSSGLGAFVAYLQAMRAKGGTLRLINLNPSCYRLFQITGLTDVMNVEARDDPPGA